MENTRPNNRQWSPKEIDIIDSNKITPDLRTLVTTHQSERKNNLHPREGKTWRSVQTVGDSKRWKKISSCAAWSELHTKSTIDEISGEWMGTNCDEKCSCSRSCEKQQQNDRNNSKRLGSRIALRLKFPAYYPPVGAAAARIQLPIGRGARNQGGTLYLWVLQWIPTPSYQLKGPTSPRIVTSKQLSKHAWNAAHCTVNTFIHKHPKHLIVPS